MIHDSAVVLKEALFTDIYEVSKELGRGSFGIVKLCKHRQSGVEFAAKFLNQEFEIGSNVNREIQMHNITNSHPSFVRLVEAYDTFEDFVLVTELMKGGDIIEYFSRGEEWKESYTINILRDLLNGIAFLHSKNIGHFDIKLDNILLTGPLPQGQPKICDLGSMRNLNGGKELFELVGTIDYMAPEILAHGPLSTACDMWSVGVVAYVLLTNTLPFTNETSDRITKMNIIKAMPRFPKSWFKSVSQGAIDFVKKLLVKEPKNRMTAEEALNHPWLKVKDALESPFREETEIVTIEELVSKMQCGEAIDLPFSFESPVILDKNTDAEENNDSGISSLDCPLSDSDSFHRKNRPLKAMENVNNNVTSLMKKDSSLSIDQPVFRSENFNSVYAPMSELHRGCLSDVKKCWKQNTGKEYAVKFTSKTKDKTLAKRRALNEIQILQMTNGLPHIITLFEIYENESDYILVSELMRGGDLFNYMDKEGILDEKLAVRVIRQVVQGLSSLHKLNIAHLHICPENVLCSISLGIIKICDFALARIMENGKALCGGKGNIDYASPEVMSSAEVSTASDMWSVGALTYSLLTDFTPFDTIGDIMEVNLKFPDDIFQSVSSVGIDFIKKLLVKHPEQRLTAEKCLEHPWLKA